MSSRFETSTRGAHASAAVASEQARSGASLRQVVLGVMGARRFQAKPGAATLTRLQPAAETNFEATILRGRDNMTEFAVKLKSLWQVRQHLVISSPP